MRSRRSHCNGWLVALAVATAPGVPVPTAEAEVYYERAKRYIDQGKTRDALDVLKAAPAPADPAQQARRLNGQGWIHYKEGRAAEADRLFRRALSVARQGTVDDLEIKILNNMGINHFVAGELDAAEDAFEQAQARESPIAERYLDLIRAHRTTVTINGHIQRGIGHRLNREFDAAVAEYSQALEIDPANSNALAYRGYAYYRLDRFDEARADIRRSLESAPNRLDSVINLLKVSCWGRTGDSVDALLAEFRSVIAAEGAVIASDRELATRCPAVAARIEAGAGRAEPAGTPEA